MSCDPVLVVDDDLVTQLVVSAQLEALGYQVLRVTDGATAVQTARDADPAVLLLDMELPDVDGLTLLDQLQADRDLRRIPVLCLTARNDAQAASQALRRGAHDYLRKPVEEVELTARVAAAVRVKRLQDDLIRLARTDDLTGLPNRRAATEMLQQAQSAAGRWDLDVSVLLVDIDRFKRVNDELGHPAGDTVLCQVARRLLAALRTEDVCARWGGEEFLVLLLGIPAEGTRAAAERLRAAVARTPVPCEDGLPVRVTVSVGACNARSRSTTEMIHCADAALYEAKRAGRDQVRVRALPAGSRDDRQQAHAAGPSADGSGQDT